MMVLWFRGVLVALGALGIVLVIVTARGRYRDEPDRPAQPGFMVTRLGVAALLAAVTYGTIESHVLEVPPAPRMWVLLVALVWLNYGMVMRVVERRRRDRQ